MSIQVNDFQWEPGKNDAEYIKLLESSKDEWQKLAQKAITKLKTLSKAQEPKVMTLEEVQQFQKNDVFWLDTIGVNHAYPVIVASRRQTEKNDGSMGTICCHTFCYSFHEDEYYNITWRAWTARPTDAQWEATLWN